MKKYLLALLTLTSTLVCSASANECFDTGLYVKGFGGVNFLDLSKSLGMKTGFIGGASIGYKFENSIRVEGEFSYRKNRFSKSRHYGFGHTDRIKGSCATYSVMANMYYDFDLDSNFTPYIGQGIGYAQNRARLHDFGKGKDDVFAYQSMIGCDYKICEKTYAGLEYKFFAPGKHAYDHAVAASMKRYF